MAWTKDPDAVLDYTFNWTKWLNKGDIISSATFTISGDDENLSISGTDIGRKTAIVLLSGGTDKKSYSVTCRVGTRDGLTDDRTETINVVER